MDYRQAIQYLNSFINYEKQNSYDYSRSFKLERMRRLASLLGDPHKAVNSIHIAGTKGKGSTAALTYSMLKSAGFRVGLYTSPHLASFRERIRVNDVLISEADVVRLLDIIKPAVDGLGSDAPSFFEVYTALAYLYFKEKKVDFAVYEVGLGGRLDATNIIEPLVSVITPLSYEHMDKLGTTIHEIAYEKAGIIKDHGICIMAPQEREAAGTIENICKKKNARLIRVGEDIRFKEVSHSDENEVFDVSGLCDEYNHLEMRLLGYHQLINAATAIGVVESLRFNNISVKKDAIREGIRIARWPGRLEVISKNPLLILDGAQNRASARALSEAIKRSFKYGKLILVLGVSKDKDLNGILAELLPISDTVIMTKSNVTERAMEPSAMKDCAGSGNGEIILTSNVEEALDKATAIATPADLILITGSLFVVGEARRRKVCCESNL